MFFNLSLDDYSPRPKTNNLKWCNKLIKNFPDIKIDLFVPAAYCRLGEDPYFLSKHPEWIKEVKKLPKNYRINTHGYYHRRISHKYGNSNNDEFQFLNEMQAEEVINHMIKEFNKAKLPFRKVFRPPGYKISISSTKVLAKKGFIIAGDTKYYKLISPRFNKMQWVSYNWDISKKCEVKNDNIIAFGHTSEWCSNYIGEQQYNYIKSLLNKKRFEFKFIEELT